MIYTVSNREETEKKLAEREAVGERVWKEGVSSRSRGGAVWQTREEAEAWLASRSEAEKEQAAALAIYGLDAVWDRDTSQYKGEDFHRLIIARPIVRLPA